MMQVQSKIEDKNQTTWRCPLCDNKLSLRNKNGRLHFICSTPECHFHTPATRSGKPKSITRLDKYTRKVLNFLKSKHSYKLCEICNGKQNANDFYNSLIHQLLNNGSLSDKQINSIKDKVETFSRFKTKNDGYDFPPNQNPAEWKIEELKKYML